MISKAKALGILAPVVLGAVIGAAFQYYFQLAKPDVTLLDVTLPTLEQSDIPKTEKVQVSEKLQQITKQSETFQDLGKVIAMSDLATHVSHWKALRASSAETMSKIGEWLPKLDTTLSLDEKKQIMLMLGDHDLIDAMFTGGIARGEEKYPPPRLNEIANARVVFPYEANSDSGFDFYLSTANYHFYYRDKSFDHLLRPAADALARFNQPYLKKILAAARQDIEKADNEAATLLQETDKLLQHAEGLYVRALVVNTGGSPVSLTPWGTLRLFASGARGDFVIPLKLVKGSYVSIKPGESEQLLFESMDTVEEIDKKYSGIEEILKSETVVSKLALKRADLTGTGGWFQSSTRVLTANEDVKPEAVQVGSALKR